MQLGSARRHLGSSKLMFKARRPCVSYCRPAARYVLACFVTHTLDTRCEVECLAHSQLRLVQVILH